MSLRPVTDVYLTCAACGNRFVFSAGEQQLYALRGVSHQPERCPGCARNRFTHPGGERPAKR